MAALWKLPVIYIVENNLYAMGTSLSRSSSVVDLTVRCAVPYGIPGVVINGNDIELMAMTTREAVNRARAGEGPSFIEAQTYRYKGHSISDPGKYRHKDELDSAVRNDPIVVYEKILKERGWIDQEAIDRMHESVKEEVEESIAFAEQSAMPPPEALYEDITVAPYIPQE
jgi:pyruvate dehydrogenase E1 component alpha subunit